ncbi:MAG: DUF1998 domain-containing protein [Thermoanaerobaculia bacterium]|nr:DUF1998 domain-containing protein [Thermoanaerobaculia bacterium]
MSSHLLRKSEAGELRPSQILTTFGIGSLVDLPNLSVIVMGLDDWPVAQSTEISEERLLSNVQEILGPQVTKLMSPPRGEDSQSARTNWFDESRLVGVPVAPFPRWMICSWCRLLAPIGSGLFEPKIIPYRPDKTRYVHSCSGKKGSPATVLPARFIVACEKGHLNDFPWVEFVHRGAIECQGPLTLYEPGPSGEAADIQIECRVCHAKRRMAEAFGRENQRNLPPCEGRRPHLRDREPGGCDVANVRTMLQGASNTWYSIPVTVLSLPHAKDDLGILIEESWPVLALAESAREIAFARRISKLNDLAKYSDAEIWAAVEKKRKGSQEAPEKSDIKTPEWKAFSNPGSAPQTRTFKLRAVDPPDRFTHPFERIVIADALREVKALIGFTRIESPRDFDTPFLMPEGRRAPLSRKPPTWVPASETLGEGIFFQFAEDAFRKWLSTSQAQHRNQEFEETYIQWRKAKDLPPTGYPGLRYTLIHSFSHAMIRELAMECGYTAASLSERIYCSDGSEGEPMAGVLIYTAAPDSEGTLGGLSSLGEPQSLGRYINQALERMSLCSSDPLCAEHQPLTDETLHGAACHACLYLPETTCERGNNFLDRSVLVTTVERGDLGFFRT